MVNPNKVKNFQLDNRQKPLGLTIKKPGQGKAGIADFSAGCYPACSIHGAMNKVSKDANLWRCLICNIGIEYKGSDWEPR